MVCYFEAILRPEENNLHPLDRKLQGQAEHVPISISEHQFKGGAFHAADVFCCFEDPDQLIQLVLVTCMEEIAMLKHERICQNKTKFIFPGLFYQRKENILKQLKEFNCVPANDCVYEWFIVFDFEAILRPEKNTPLDRK